MEKDCGAWINLLSHKVKARLNAMLLNLGNYCGAEPGDLLYSESLPGRTGFSAGH